MCCAVTETEPFVQRRTQGISGVSLTHGCPRRHSQGRRLLRLRKRLLGLACMNHLSFFEQGRNRWLVSFITFRSTPVLVLRPLICTLAASHSRAPLPRKFLVTETGQFVHRCTQGLNGVSRARGGCRGQQMACGKLQAEDLRDGTAAVGGAFSYFYRSLQR